MPLDDCLGILIRLGFLNVGYVACLSAPFFGTQLICLCDTRIVGFPCHEDVFTLCTLLKLLPTFEASTYPGCFSFPGLPYHI